MKWRVSVTSSVIAVAMAGVGLTGLNVGAAQAQTAPPGGTWGQARQLSGLPAGSGLDRLSIDAVSCASAGNCSAIGSYELSTANLPSEAFVVTERGGIWGRAQAVGGLATLNVGESVFGLHISCAKPGNCTAVGDYSRGKPGQGPYNFAVPFAVSQVNGVWGKATPISVGELGGSSIPARIAAISCSSPGGLYQADNKGGGSSFVAEEKTGVWGSAEVLPGLATLSPRPLATLTGLSCAAAGECTAAGYYESPTGGRMLPFVASEKGGAWNGAQLLPGSLALNVGGGINGEYVSCPAAGDCTLAATYWPYSPLPQPVGDGSLLLAATETNGAWGKAVNIRGLPMGALAGSHVEALSCGSAGNCSLGGYYDTQSDLGSAFVANDVNGAWRTAQRIAVPPASHSTSEVTAISCGAPRYCSAMVSYNGTSMAEFAVNEATASATQLKLSTGTVTYGKERAARITVAVTSVYGTPTGSVTVTAGGRRICTVGLKSGKGSCALTAKELKPGSYRMVASYSGSALYNGSSSPAKTLKVAR